MVTVELDPGAHVFGVARDGAPERVVRISLAAGAAEPLLLRAPLPAKTAPSPSARDSARAPVVPSRAPAYAAFGVGAAGILTGSIAGIFALAKKSGLEGQCPGGACPTGEPTSNLDAANDAATVATVVSAWEPWACSRARISGGRRRPARERCLRPAFDR